MMNCFYTTRRLINRNSATSSTSTHLAITMGLDMREPLLVANRRDMHLVADLFFSYSSQNSFDIG